ncbi:LOW QUALITY PROTEIN: alpha-L-arabinofuranosidase 1-like [Carica papaya]|uniref:LOW QUALITY PROTEIN: alpha-L-arabinofuranosidase 1-like n=1 Tax=Carica papaya TaxID=3649 RepID=UPI000B8CD8DA|nr:LOW QUALITY PROTEIN: alpha-L-arabinofuranosidase 1-like [Carica papaya]
MASKISCLLLLFVAASCVYQSSALHAAKNQTAWLTVDASEGSGRLIPETLFGIFFEEINHAGVGGLWAELVSNRGFEAGGSSVPSNIDPWTIIGDDSSVIVSTDLSSPFDSNRVALRMDVLCDSDCPPRGVGVYNPGYWGMNIQGGKKYQVVLYLRSSRETSVAVSLASSNGSEILASANITVASSDVGNWTRKEFVLEAKGTDPHARLQLTTTTKGALWFDQVSAMPLDTYKGLGFRNDLFQMLVDIKPRFLRFPGGCYVEGEWLRNAFRWKETIGPWEQRPGHFGDVWKYWSDDGLGYLEYLQLAEELHAAPVWVFNIGISHNDEVNTTAVLPFIQEALDSIEFARGDSNSTWGSVRAELGHPEPFDLKYIALGNEDCGKPNYRELQCKRLPFISEYAVTDGAGNGTLLSAVAEAGFLIGVEKNSDIVEMASYAPLFVNVNDRMWTPDAIVFDSSRMYGTPSYWMQQFFRESSGATLLNSTLQTNSSDSLIADAITWKDTNTGKNNIKIKIVNFGWKPVILKVSLSGIDSNFSWTQTELTSCNVTDENSLDEPDKIVPRVTQLGNVGEDLTFLLSPHSITSYDLMKN